MLTIRTIEPWLVTRTIREPTVGTTDSDVQNQIETPIEWGAVRTTEPGVLKDSLLAGGRVGDDSGEVSTVPEGFVEREVQRAMEPRVDIDPQEIGGPFESVLVEILVKRLAALEPPSIRLPNRVQGDVWTPVEGAADVVNTLSGIPLVVSSRFHDLW